MYIRKSHINLLFLWRQVVNQEKKIHSGMIKIPKLIIHIPMMNDCVKIIGNEIMEILASA